MASSKDRQRALARAKYDRQMARRAAAARRKRQIRAGIGAGLAVLLVVLGGVWLFGGFEGEPEEAAAQDQCVWTPQDASANTNLKDVGTPPAEDLPAEGTRPMTITTGQGDIEVELSVTDAQCGTAGLTYLASENYYDGTTCHELTDKFLRCGDHSGTGQGGPTFTHFGENVPPPADEEPAGSPGASPEASPDAAGGDAAPQYTRGMVALAATAPGNFSSQFVIFHKDLTTTDPSFAIVGTVVEGMDVVDKIVKAGTVDNGSGAQVKPAEDVTIQTLTVGDVVAPATSPSPGGASPDDSPGASPAGRPSPTAQS